MHAYEPEDLTSERRRWAEQANHHHARIRRLLMIIAMSGQQTRSILQYETELAGAVAASCHRTDLAGRDWTRPHWSDIHPSV